jgi:hypothetical protein
MKADRRLIVLALSATLAACGKDAPPSTVASGGGTPSASAQIAPSGDDFGPVVVSGKRTKADAPDPDAALAASVKARLIDAGFAAHAVDVASASGAITLYGTVDSVGTRDELLRVAGAVEGVKSVAHNLVIVRGS